MFTRRVPSRQRLSYAVRELYSGRAVKSHLEQWEYTFPYGHQTLEAVRYDIYGIHQTKYI